MSPNKFGAKRCEHSCACHGTHKHDSLGERDHCYTLHVRAAQGEIRDLAVHPWYELEVNGALVCIYEADWSFDTLVVDAPRVVVDFKSQPTRTAVYRLKKKLMKAIYDIDVVEVQR